MSTFAPGISTILEERKTEVKIARNLVRNWSKTGDRKDVEAYVGRKSSAVPGSLLGADGRYGNPYVVGVHGTREEVIEKFRLMLYGDTVLPSRSGTTSGRT